MMCIILLGLVSVCTASELLQSNLDRLVFLNYYATQENPPQPLINVPCHIVGNFVLPVGRHIPLGRFCNTNSLPFVPGQMFAVFIQEYIGVIRACRHKLHTSILSAKTSRDHARLALLKHVENVERIIGAIHNERYFKRYRFLLMESVKMCLCPVLTLPPNHSEYIRSSTPYFFAQTLFNYVTVKPRKHGKQTARNKPRRDFNTQMLPAECWNIITSLLGPYLVCFRLVNKHCNSVVKALECYPNTFWHVYQYRSFESTLAGLRVIFDSIKSCCSKEARKDGFLSLLKSSPLVDIIMGLDCILNASTDDNFDYFIEWDLKADLMELIDDRQSGFWAERLRKYIVYKMDSSRIQLGLRLIYWYAEYKKYPNLPRSFDNLEDWKQFTGFRTHPSAQ